MKYGYWNQDSFEGMVAVAAALRADGRFTSLASYCELREQGLRREAFAALDAFLTRALGAGTGEQRELVLRILSLHRAAPSAHQFLADPLRRRFIEPVLEAWRAAEPGAVTPVRELALLRSDIGLLRAALELDPDDDAVRIALAGELLRIVDFATHHLAESQFLGDEAEQVDILNEIRQILDGVTDAAAARGLLQAVADLDRLLADWLDYRADPRGSFPEWCAAHGRSHQWSRVYYYG